MLFIQRGVKKDTYGDRHVGSRKQRFVVLPFVLLSVAVGLGVMLAGRAPQEMIAMVDLFALTAITFAWKISVHQAVATGSVTMIAVAYGPWTLLGFALAALVGWSRIELRDRTPAQVAAGTALGTLLAVLSSCRCAEFRAPAAVSPDFTFQNRTRHRWLGSSETPIKRGGLMASEVVVAQTTIDDEELAKALARGAVERWLAAGAHIDPPLTAVYWWKGAIETAQEWRVSYKTTAERLPELAAWVAEQHSYEVPEWVVFKVDGGSEAYLAWVGEQTFA